MSARTAARGRQREERLHPAIPAIVVLGLTLGFLFAALSGQFTVRQIQVVGRNLPVEAIDSSAQVVGANIFTVRSDTVVTNLQGLQEIAVRRVDVAFPDRVIIYARRRQAMVAWKTAGGLYLLDSQGRIIKSVRATFLPIITSTEKDRSLGPGVVEAVHEAVRLLPGEPDGAIAAFRYDPSQGLTINGKSGWVALVGMGSRRTMANRIATLAAFLNKVRGDGQTFGRIDLRSSTPYATEAP
jgi:cell division septal protein FtsQ